jgi:2-oxoglutarate ferredoxin oxidoreductase subunit alpha
MNQDAITHDSKHLNAKAIVLYDPSKVNADSLDGKGFRLVKLPMLEIATKAGGSTVMRNVAAIGATLGFIGVSKDTINDVLKHMFLRKGQEVVDLNSKIADTGYGYEGVSDTYHMKGDGKQRYVIDGNSAIAMGAYAGGCKFYAAYPMTPASGIMHWFAAHENRGALFKQTEDEIAAINMTIGAASAGARAMCGTSGGGFSLMVEALGLSGMLEVPIVVVNSQRTGPSTGLPTKTEQGDMLFALHASQGEFPRIVVAPRNVEECFTMGTDAMNLAEKYQCPVLVLLDLYVSEHIETVDAFDTDSIKIERGKVVEGSKNGERFKRYLLTEDGISPRAYIGTPGREFMATSYEHNEYGDLVSDVLSGLDEHVAMRSRMQEKRMMKTETMLKNETIFVPSITNEKAKYHLVTFGSTTEPATDALDILKAKGMDFGLISFNYLEPLDEAKTKSILSGKTLIDVECNYTAQLAQLIRMRTGIEIRDRILKYDGEAMTAEEIAEKAEELVKRSK